MSLVPGKYDLDLVAGDSFSQGFVIETDGTPVDMTGWEWAAQIRDGYYPDGELVATAAVSVDLGTSTVTLSLTPAQTQIPPFRSLVWDMQATVGGDVQTWLAGRVNVKQEVTHV